jgi:hypothetical protein
VSNVDSALIDLSTAFAMFPVAGFSFAVDSHVLRSINTTPPLDGCLDLADIFTLPRPQGGRRSLELFDPGHEVFQLTVGSSVRVRDIALRQVQRIPKFIAQLGAMRYAFAIIEDDHNISYVLDTVALAHRHREEFG